MLEEEKTQDEKKLKKKLSNTVHLMRRKKIDHDRFKNIFDSFEDKKD